MYRRAQGSYFTLALSAAAPQLLKEQHIVSICILIKCSKIDHVGFVTGTAETAIKIERAAALFLPPRRIVGTQTLSGRKTDSVVGGSSSSQTCGSSSFLP